jgi:predicted component of type VI protein secretion system
MKLALVVMTPGKMEGKAIPITLAQFVIGRDPQCNLRPASPVISKRHCALLIKGEKAFVRDFESTNGTFVNDQPVKGEVELQNADVLMVGPIRFAVNLEPTPAPVNKPTPLPATKTAAATEDDDIAAMLLSLQDDGDTASSGGLTSEVPEGSTVMDLPAPIGAMEQAAEAAKNKGQTKPAVPTGDTRSAAKNILEKYMRRPRSQ